MPLKRTPPPPASPARSESAPDLAAPISSRKVQADAFRQRRPREEITLNDLMDSMSLWKSVLEDFKNDQDRRLDTLQASVVDIRKQHEEKWASLQSSISELRQQNDDIHSSIEFLAKQNTELKDKVVAMERVQKENKDYIRDLEEKIETLERENRSSTLEIRNIPVTKSETKDDLLNIFHKVANALNVNVSVSDVNDIYRVSTKSVTNKPIVCKLQSALLRERLLKSVKDFNKAHKENRFSTEHIHMPGVPQPIFIAENLTPKMRRLYFLARSFAGTNDYSFCWLSRGRIYLRKREGHKTFNINSETDLIRLEHNK
ncbi:unnamed protein product [Diatraea saccharalis]|uniref:FP protein C-terminal domain-containing protein n=1 Tax=Diatraea saccharalis TaxID=40085 RepID=A0A9N9W9N5_9NEOP|nr:unnamed protein product [Diatraea saccharalis]